MSVSSEAAQSGAPVRGAAASTDGAGRAWRRGLVLAAMVAGAAWAVSATGAAEEAAAVARAGGELVRLLRFMALVKAAMASAALAALWWRLALPAAAGRLLAYACASAAMAAGPVLIWGLAHVGLGAVLLHGGFFFTLVALWRDPDVAAKLDAMIAARRRAATR